MKRILFLVVVVALSASVGPLYAQGTADSLRTDDVRPLQGQSLAELVAAMIDPLQPTANIELCDSLGYQWSLTISGSTVTGSVDVCPTPWPVTGSLLTGPGCPAAKLDLFADGTLANCGFCNAAIHMSGAVDLGSRTLDAYHDQQAGCTGTAVVSAGLCP